MNSVTSICVFCGLLNNHSSDLLQTEDIPVDPSQSTFKYKKYFWLKSFINQYSSTLRFLRGEGITHGLTQAVETG